MAQINTITSPNIKIKQEAQQLKKGNPTTLSLIHRPLSTINHKIPNSTTHPTLALKRNPAAPLFTPPLAAASGGVPLFSLSYKDREAAPLIFPCGLRRIRRSLPFAAAPFARQLRHSPETHVCCLWLTLPSSASPAAERRHRPLDSPSRLLHNSAAPPASRQPWNDDELVPLLPRG